MADLVSTPTEEIQISETRYSDMFEFRLLMGRSGQEKFASDASSDKLSRLVTNVRNSRAAECRRGTVDYRSAPLAERDAHMRAVLDAGWALFQAMIPDASQRDKFRKILAANAGKTIRVVAEGVCFPWEALCMAEKPDDASFADFLGWNHIISREVDFPYGRQRSGSTVPTTHFGLVEDENLASVRSGKTRISASNLGAAIVQIPLTQLTHPSHRAIFRAFFEDENAIPKQIVQFDCHIANADAVQASHMRVSSNFQIPFRIFEELEVLHEPFVFLNACSGGSVGWHDTDGYAGTLHAAGAALVVAADADLGDDFMSDFAGLFYLNTHDSTDVAEALLKTKRMVLSEDRNPSALFYSLYGDFEYRLAPGGPAGDARADRGGRGAVPADIWPPQPGPTPDFRPERQQ